MAGESASSSTAASQAPDSQPSTSSEPQQAQNASETKPKKKYQPVQIPTAEHILWQDVMDNCVIKAAMSFAMGGAFGGAFGLFSASLDNAGPGLGLEPMPQENKPTRVILKEMALNMKNKGLSYAKGFAIMGGLYSFNECVIEKHRAKHDMVNAALAGCATGGMMAYSGGPKAMCFGCASFAAFSTGIEYFLQS